MSEGQELEPLAEEPGGGRAVAVRSESAGIIAGILSMARDPAVDASKVETLANLAIRLQDRELQAEFNRDLAAAIIDMPRITKRGQIVIPANREKGTPQRIQSNYAKFEDIDRAAKPVLARNNLVISFDVGHDQQQILVTPVLRHRNGHTERGEQVKLPLDTSGSKNNVQGVASAASYGKRIAIKAALNIIEEGEDDDGNLGIVPSDPITDVQSRLLEAAAIAAEQGPEAYAEWFDRQGVRDRAWLVESGRHAAFGGGEVSLPPPAERRRPSPPPPAPPPPAPPPPPPPAADPGSGEAGPKKAKLTPLQWVEGFEREIGTITNPDRFDEYLDGKREALARLKDSDPELWKRADQAQRDRREAIEDGRLV